MFKLVSATFKVKVHVKIRNSVIMHSMLIKARCSPQTGLEIHSKAVWWHSPNFLN